MQHQTQMDHTWFPTDGQSRLVDDTGGFHNRFPRQGKVETRIGVWREYNGEAKINDHELRLTGGKERLAALPEVGPRIVEIY